MNKEDVQGMSLSETVGLVIGQVGDKFVWRGPSRFQEEEQ